MAVSALAVTGYLAAAGMFALAGWLLVLKARSPVNQAFAAFLVCRGGITLVNRLETDVGGFAGPVSWARVGGYLSLAVVPLVVYFLLVYLRPRERGLRRGLQLAPLVLGAVAVETYGFAPCLNACATAQGTLALGPLSLLSLSYSLAYACVALALAIEGTRREPGARREAAYLLSAAFALNGVLNGALVTANVLVTRPFPAASGFAPSPWSALFLASNALAFLLSLGAMGAFTVLALREPQSRGKVAATWAAAVAAGLSGAWIGARLAPLGLGAFLLGLWRSLLAALPAYALVRHRLFDLDVKLRWTISRGTVALAFLAMFFVVSQVAQSYLTTAYGWWIGGLAAGVLLFALSPLERVGERIARAILPTRHPEGQMSMDDRKALFLSQVRMAWADGALDRNERRLLEDLRQRLGLSVADAAILEHQGMAETAAPA